MLKSTRLDELADGIFAILMTTLMKKIKSAGMLSDYMGSDHCPISLELK